LKQNGKAIYDTRAAEDIQDGNVYFTDGKDGSTNALVLLSESEPIAQTVQWKGHFPKKGSTMKLLANDSSVKWKIEGDVVKVILPASFLKLYKTYPALAFSYTPEM
jgi:alpha-L-fucosidase